MAYIGSDAEFGFGRVPKEWGACSTADQELFAARRSIASCLPVTRVQPNKAGESPHLRLTHAGKCVGHAGAMLITCELACSRQLSADNKLPGRP